MAASEGRFAPKTAFLVPRCRLALKASLWVPPGGNDRLLGEPCRDKRIVNACVFLSVC